MSLKAAVLFCALIIIGIYAEDDFSTFFKLKDKRVGRSYGGTKSDLVPYMVALTIGNNPPKFFLCGASILTKRYVLTAAHCLEDKDVYSEGQLSSSLFGRAGSIYNYKDGITFSFSSAVIHPDFDIKTYKNDIAILVTNIEIEMSDTVSPVSMSFKNISAGVRAVIRGWGETETRSMSRELLKLNVEVVGTEKCAKIMGANNVDPNIEICAATKVSHGSTCSGDSGGPLVEKDTIDQIGILSWGIGCRHSIPAVYTRVSAYKDWINGVISKDPE